MSKRTTIWLIVAVALMVIGCIMFVSVMASLGWEFTSLSTNRYETNEYQLSEDFRSISIVADTADIVFVPSENATCRVVCYEQANQKHSVAVKDGVLVIEVVDERKWYEYIGFNFGDCKLTVYLPKGEYGALSIESDTGDVEISDAFGFESVEISEHTGRVTNHASVLGEMKIQTTTGDILLENVSAGTLVLSVSTGRVTVSDVSCEGDVKVNVSTGRASLVNVTCKNLISNGDTGEISLKNVIASGKFFIERSTGDVRFECSDAAEIFVETDTGDVRGTLLSEKVFVVETDTGRIDVPKSVTGGRCEITTDTGDIKITIVE